MLPAAHRMRRAADFTETTRSGARSTRGRVVVYLQTRPDRDEPVLVGLIVGRAVGSSVVRHRVARRIRAGLAPLLGDLPRGSRLVVRALAGAGVRDDLAGDVTDAVHAVASRGPA